MMKVHVELLEPPWLLIPILIKINQLVENEKECAFRLRILLDFWLV